MKITVGVVAYNEEKNLPSLLKDIEGQSYPHSEMEVVLADSMSTDGTRKVMEEWQKENRDLDVYKRQQRKRNNSKPIRQSWK